MCFIEFPKKNNLYRKDIIFFHSLGKTSKQHSYTYFHSMSLIFVQEAMIN